MDRTILHCDLNSFYASVECLFRPELKEVPMAVAGNPENRHGIILAKNESAKKYGVRTAETVWQAKKKCPELTLVPPHHSEYARFSVLVNDIYGRYTDLVEPFGIDESWLDITGVYHLTGDGRETADEIRRVVREELGLTISVGVSFNKVFAKLGSDYKKPDATTVITRDNFMQIVYPLPVTDLLYVGKSTAETLGRMRINTIGDLARSNKAEISARLGKIGGMLWEYAGGLEDSPVRSKYQPRDVRSIGSGITFRRNLLGLEDVKSGVYALSDEVAYRMRKQGLKARIIAVSIKDTKLKTISRQRTLDSPTHLTKEIAQSAIGIIESSWNFKTPIRMLTITASGLVGGGEDYEQISLFSDEADEGRKKLEQLGDTIDQIREKYGKGALSLGGVLKNDLGIEEYTHDK